MSSEASIGLRVMLEDNASAGLNLISDSLLNVGDSAQLAASVFSEYASGVNEVLDWNKALIDSFTELSGIVADTASVMQDGAAAAGDYAAQVLDAGDQLLTTGIDTLDAAEAIQEFGSALGDVGAHLDEVVPGTEDLAAALQNVASGSIDATQSLIDLSAAEDEEASSSNAMNSAFMAKFAVFQVGQMTFQAFSGAVSTAITNAADLQESMTNLQIATGATDQQMQNLSAVIIQIANNSKFTATDVSNSFALISENGYSVQNILDGMGQAAVNLAIATNSDLNPATELLTSTMRTFGASADQANAYASMLTYSFYHGIPSISGMQQALASAAGEAATMHIPFDQVIAVLDYMTRSGLSAEQAGTSLRYMLSALASPTSKAAQEIQALGVSFYDTQGNLKPLPQMILDLVNAIRALPTQADQLNALSQIFNVRSGQGAMHLLNDPNLAQDLASAISGADAAAGGNMAGVDSAKKRLDFSTQITALTTSLNTFMAAVAQPFLSMLGSVADKINAIAGAVSQANSPVLGLARAFLIFGTLGGAVLLLGGIASLFTLTGAAIGGGLVAAVLAFAAGGALIVQHWKQVQSALTVIGSVLSHIGSILVGVAGSGGIVALIYGLRALREAAQAIDFGKLVLGIGEMAGKALQALPNLSEVGAGILGLIPRMMTLTTTLYLQAGAWLAAYWPVVLLAAVFIVVAAGIALVVQHFGLLNVILAAARSVWAVLQPTLSSVANDLRGAFLSAIQQLQPVWSQLVQAFNQARPALMAVGMLFGAILAVNVAIFIGLLNGVIRAIGAILVAAIQVVAGVIRAFMGVIQFFIGLFNVIVGLVTGNTRLVQSGFHQMAQGIQNIVMGLWNAVKAVFVGAFNMIRGLISGFISGIIGFFKNLADTLVHHSIVPDMAVAIVKTITLMISQVIAAIVAFVTNFILQILHLQVTVVVAIVTFVAQFLANINRLPGIVLNAVAALPGIALRAMASLGNAFLSGAQNAVNWLRSGLSAAVGIVSNLGGELFQSGLNAIHMLANGIMSGISAVTSAVGSAANAVKNFLGFHSPTKEGPLSDSDEYMPNMMKMYAAGIKNNAHLIHSAIGDVAAGMNPANLVTPTINGLRTANTSTTGAYQTIILTIDGQKVGQVTQNFLTGQLTQAGMNRKFR
jgi:TP901 family phage tail tape measure protein